MDNIYNVLNNYLKRSNKNSTNEVICRYMMNHLLEIPDLSVNEIAEACYTSHPSIIRFCKEIGFEGIADFKYSVQNYLDEVKNHEMRVNFSIDISSMESFQATLPSWLTRQNDYYLRYLSKIDYDKIIRLCHQIRYHENVCILGAGLSNAIGELFRIELARCGKIINVLPADLSALNESKAEETLLIVISMYGYLVENLNREYPQNTLKTLLKKYTDQSWLITLDGLNQKPVTDELIGIGDRKSSFDMTLNLMVLFFEIVAECYQNIYPE